MKVVLDLKKSLEANANEYYEKSKKAKKKLEGLKHAYEKTKARIESLREKRETTVASMKEENIPVKKEWYEKFRWFYSSEGFLCIGGRDATTNEIIIKKHTQKNDLVFHTEIAGSPFFVIKTEGKTVGEATIREAAQATAAYSKAWKIGTPAIEAYYVKPEQVSKTAPTGQYLTKGSFMIYDKRNYITAELKLAIGIKNSRIIGGPVDAIKANGDKFIVIKQGSGKSTDVAKKIKDKIGGELEEIQKFLPTGNMSLG